MGRWRRNGREGALLCGWVQFFTWTGDRDSKLGWRNHFHLRRRGIGDVTGIIKAVCFFKFQGLIFEVKWNFDWKRRITYNFFAEFFYVSRVGSYGATDFTLESGMTHHIFGHNVFATFQPTSKWRKGGSQFIWLLFFSVVYTTDFDGFFLFGIVFFWGGLVYIFESTTH